MTTLFRRIRALGASGPSLTRLGELSPEARELQDELRRRVAGLPALEAGRTDSEREWLNNRRLLREEIASKDARRFLDWQVLKGAMVVAPDAPYVVETEVPALRKAGWLPLLTEDPCGSPRYVPGTCTSGNLAHHAYHALRFQELTGRSLGGYKSVFEFGAGYGSMCRLLYRLSLGEVQATLFDLPEFSALQQYYLGMIGIRARFETDPAALKPLEGRERLFVATWSLSETPLALREQVLGSLGDFEGYLIAYQETFNEVDNVEYFKAFAHDRPDVTWVTEPIRHLPGQHYLFGVTG